LKTLFKICFSFFLVWHVQAFDSFEDLKSYVDKTLSGQPGITELKIVESIPGRYYGFIVLIWAQDNLKTE